MKSTVEKLSPTRVRINVEVPFAELGADFDRACKELAKQVRLPGFRPGKVPVKLLEARIDKEAMLDQVVNDAVPSRYSEAVTSSDVRPLGQPEIEITKKEYGEDLAFTAEVDIRPEITLPDLKALKITVDPIEVTDEDVDAELQSLRARFGTLTGVERPAQNGDFVSIDLSATVDGEDVPEAATEGLSHEIGSGQLIEGLDDAIVGLSEGESRVFTTTLVAGEHAGQEAQVTVTVKSVKERELPEPDDEFAQLASEFDTIDELQRQPHRPGAPAEARPAGRADPRQGAGGPARAGRRPAAGGDRAGAGRRHRAQRHPRPRPRRGAVRRVARPNRAAAARSSTPTPARTPRRPSRPSC